ncbi:hypothetical protein C1H46_023055 [Malus baccata]|uniref:Uncharacterized protein n=1 Tax=Malus baccata TaxID=106549 RepID=A0A540LYA1_MALBA|nr:hypothetical protein C1H46_023055 [Malus baccata]
MKLALSLSKSNACRDMDYFLSFLAWTVSMDHLNLIGISQGGLDQPKEIHRVWEIIYATISRESRSSSSFLLVVTLTAPFFLGMDGEHGSLRFDWHFTRWFRPPRRSSWS